MANTCSRCQTYVASGRTYCDAHYQEAMADYEIEYANYQNALQQYYSDVDAWNEMSVEEQNAYHEVAEEESLSGIAIFAGLALGGGFWFFKQDEIPWWVGALVTAFSAVVFYVGRNLFSKLLRYVVRSIMGIGPNRHGVDYRRVLRLVGARLFNYGNRRGSKRVGPHRASRRRSSDRPLERIHWGASCLRRTGSPNRTKPAVAVGETLCQT